MNAPTYEEADQSATPRPAKKRRPAVLRLEVIDSIGPWKVSAAVSGPIAVTMSVIELVVRSGSPKRPRIETSAISAGKRASSP